MRRAGSAFRSALRLSWGQRLFVARSWAWLVVMAAVLRVFGFRRAQALAEQPSGTWTPREDLASASASARLVHAAGRWTPFRTTCLVQSLVLTRLLRRQGLGAELHIGVAKPEGRFAAHAWVEHSGVTLNEGPDTARCFAPFDSRLLSERSRAR